MNLTPFFRRLRGEYTGYKMQFSLRALVVIAFLSIFWNAACATLKRAPLLRLSFDCQKTNTLVFKLTNPTAKSLRVPYQALPWATNSWSMRYNIYILKDSEITKLDPERVIADYFTTEEIGSAASLSGVQNLASVVKDLSRQRSDGDVIIYWSFDFGRLSDPLAKWRTDESGTVFLPKTGFLNDRCGGVIYNSE